jgi:hypothetical protein
MYVKNITEITVSKAIMDTIYFTVNKAIMDITEFISVIRFIITLKT